MRRTIRRGALTALAGAVLVIGPVGAQQDASWVHVRIQESDGSQASIDLPASFVEVAMSMMQREGGERAGSGLDVEIGDDVQIQDLRRMWNELRDAGDVQFFRAEKEGEQVRVFREGDRVFFQTDGDEKTVRVQVPVAVVDALLEGEGESLNLVGAMRELARSGNEDVIEIREGQKTVRAWVDAQQGGGR
jgi:hypothetical protein